MPGHRARRRLPRILRGLPAILLSAVFMLVTAGLPAATANSAAREQATQVGGSAPEPDTFAGAHDLSSVVVKIGSTNDDTDPPPPPEFWTQVDPLDLYRAPHTDARGCGFTAPERTPTDPDRGPPAAQRL